MTKSRTSNGHAPMAGRVANRHGACCASCSKTVKGERRFEDVLWRRTEAPQPSAPALPFVDLSDCVHGCNGDCVKSGSDLSPGRRRLMLRLADLVPGESVCVRVAIEDGQPVACGLLYLHDGVCVPFTPGDYLPPPILHPPYLRRLPMAWVCPLCGAHVTTILEESVLPFRGNSENWNRVRPESQLTYSPCGCVGRILLD